MSVGKEMEEKNYTAENNRIGYQAAIDMWAHCGDEAWSRFNVMLVAHSILIAIAGSALLKDKPLILLTFILSVAGMFLSFLWAIMMERAFAYQNYFLYSARDFEENESVDPVKTIFKGKSFENIEEYLGQRSRTSAGRIRKWIHKNIYAEKASYLVISIFGLIYLALMVVGCVIG